MVLNDSLAPVAPVALAALAVDSGAVAVLVDATRGCCSCICLNCSALAVTEEGATEEGASVSCRSSGNGDATVALDDVACVL